MTDLSLTDLRSGRSIVFLLYYIFKKRRRYGAFSFSHLNQTNQQNYNPFTMEAIAAAVSVTFISVAAASLASYIIFDPIPPTITAPASVYPVPAAVTVTEFTTPPDIVAVAVAPEPSPTT